MKRDTSRKIALITLAVLTVMLLVVAVIITIRLQNSAAPPGANAAGGGSAQCPADSSEIALQGANQGRCLCTNGTIVDKGGTCTTTTCQTTASQCAGKSNNADLGCQGNNNGFRCKCVAVSGGSGCPDILVVNCSTQDPACGSTGSNSSTGTNSSTSNNSSSGNNSQSCDAGTWQYSGNAIQVLTGTCTIQRFNGSSCPTTQNSQGTQSVGVGTYNPSPSSGSCQQVDVVGSGQGVCSCAAAASSTSSSHAPTTTISSSVSSVPSSSSSATPLPDTALISDDADRVLIGLILILFGTIAVKFSLIDKVGYELAVIGQRTQSNLKSALNFKQKKITKTRNEFEKKFSRDD